MDTQGASHGAKATGRERKGNRKARATAHHTRARARMHNRLTLCERLLLGDNIGNHALETSQLGL